MNGWMDRIGGYPQGRSPGARLNSCLAMPLSPESRRDWTWECISHGDGKREGGAWQPFLLGAILKIWAVSVDSGGLFFPRRISLTFTSIWGTLCDSEDNSRGKAKPELCGDQAQVSPTIQGQIQVRPSEPSAEKQSDCLCFQNKWKCHSP